MGGEGSGRRPSTENQVKRLLGFNQPADTDNAQIYLPNYSGVQTAALKTSAPLSAGAVSSVFTRTGDVVAATNDYTWTQINKATSSIADITTKSHTSLTDIGTNTHAAIDTHIADGTIHFTNPGFLTSETDPIWTSQSGAFTLQNYSTVLSGAHAVTSGATTTHIQDTTNPHGTTLYQDTLYSTVLVSGAVISGAAIYGGTISGANVTTGTNPGHIHTNLAAYTSGALNAVFIAASGALIASGAILDVVVPFNCTLNSYTLLPNVSGSFIVNLWKDTYANFPPTIADTLFSGGLILSANTKAQDTSLTSWNKTITTNDILRFSVSGASTGCSQVTTILNYTR